MVRIYPWLILSAALVAPLTACRDQGDPEDRAAVSAAPGKNSASGEVSLPANAAATNGILVSAVKAAPAAEVTGYAVVIDTTELVASASQWRAAIAQRMQAAARAAASAAERKRLEILNADNHNVSDRAVQDARAAATGDQAALDGASAAVSAAEVAVVQRWGAVLGQRMLRGGALANDLAQRRVVVVEAALPEGGHPPTITLRRDDGGLVPARLLSSSQRVDPRLQRPTFFYLAPAANLPVGMTLQVIVSSAAAGGVFVPLPAVVWLGGEAAVFVERAPGRYVRTPIDPSTPVAGGYLDRQIAPGTRIVVRGAEQLLSEQYKPAAAD